MKNKINVLVVDDSPLMRDILISILNSDSSIEVVGTACNGMEAVKKAIALKPHVITMDLKMPLMSGMEALEKIMEDSPIPVIVVSTVERDVVFKALSVGAMDFILVSENVKMLAVDLIEKVKIASRVKPLRRMKISKSPAPKAVRKKGVDKIVVIGSSTGGPQALQVLLSQLPSGFLAGVVIVQHMSEGFIEGLAQWLKTTSSLDVRVAAEGDVLKSSTVFLAPDGYNINIGTDGVVILSETKTKKMVHIPSIDEMMKSAACAYGKSAIGVILTGMQNDGAEGIRAIKNAGGTTIAQDEETSVVFGMNRSAIKTGCVDKIVPLEKIAGEIVKAIRDI
ncbi:MAG: chemotaxis-specific protein-glutamate methyltransferase CheB [Candidatus Ancaeobacter aquaticus]|nr:chemotaxis-specific protein-glutamate methyltransferase CheB [Candidatus Ancaeobacter aquaticus]